jgi:hypothetical protein
MANIQENSSTNNTVETREVSSDAEPQIYLGLAEKVMEKQS